VDLQGLGGEVRFRDKVLWVFASPSRCFGALRERPDWFKAWLLVAIVGLLPNVILLNTIDLKQLAEQAVDESEANQAESQEDYKPLSPQEREQAVERFVKGQWSASTLVAMMMSLLRLLVSAAAIYLLAYAFGIGGSFTGALSVWAYASIVRIPEMLISAAIVVLTEGKGLNLESLLGEGAVSPAIQLAIAQFDPFSLWQLVVAGLGLALIRSTSRARGLSVMAAIWVLWWCLGIWSLSYSPLPPAQ